jgi:hypothetical protein
MQWYFLAYFPFFVRVPPLSFWTKWPIFTKLSINIMPLEAILMSHLSISYNQ